MEGIEKFGSEVGVLGFLQEENGSTVEGETEPGEDTEKMEDILSGSEMETEA
jgi:hypothetical protein